MYYDKEEDMSNVYIESKWDLKHPVIEQNFEIALPLAKAWNELMDKLAFEEEEKIHTKLRITLQLSEEVIERIKNAVYYTPGLTLTALAEKAFCNIVDVLEKERNSPFPKRKDELKSGRPFKSEK